MKDRQHESGRAWNRSSRPTDFVAPSAKLPQSVYIALRPRPTGKRFPPCIQSVLDRLGAVCCPKGQDDDWQVWRIPLGNRSFAEIDRELASAGYKGILERHAGRIGQIAKGNGKEKKGNAAKIRNAAYRELERSGNLPFLLKELFGESMFADWRTEPNIVADWPNTTTAKAPDDGKPITVVSSFVSVLNPETNKREIVDGIAESRHWPTEYEARKRFPFIGRLWNAIQRLASAECKSIRSKIATAIADGRIMADDSDNDILFIHRAARERALLHWMQAPSKRVIDGKPQSSGAKGSETEKESLRAARELQSFIPPSAVVPPETSAKRNSWIGATGLTLATFDAIALPLTLTGSVRVDDTLLQGQRWTRGFIADWSYPE